MKLIFMGTPEFALPALRRLLSNGHHVAAVFTQPDKPAGRGNKLHPPPIKTLALENSIPVYQPPKIKTNQDVRAVFEQIAPDACVVAAYGKILPEWLLVIPRLGCINVHASLLPRYRGAAPINWAIACGEQHSGVTIMQMDAGMDTGPILASRATDIGPEETAHELSARLAEIGAELLSEVLPLLERGQIQPVPQNDAEATYAPMLKREHGLVDWKFGASQIANRVRGFQPWPGTYTELGSHRVIIWRAHAAPLDRQPGGGVPSGTIVRIDRSGVAVACGSGTTLEIEELQIEGKRRLSARDVANGLRLKPGDQFADKAG
jgi:methionyl-tRNA formyltransferase